MERQDGGNTAVMGAGIKMMVGNVEIMGLEPNNGSARSFTLRRIIVVIPERRAARTRRADGRLLNRAEPTQKTPLIISCFVSVLCCKLIPK